ncbi:hypothetical protein CDD83_4076 [Cordyceps sp. RAO-2017]|nr:hypothetical protein CDD83_4076 [Cordyceps sp. RAO-2017]
MLLTTECHAIDGTELRQPEPEWHWRGEGHFEQARASKQPSIEFPLSPHALHYISILRALLPFDLPCSHVGGPSSSAGTAHLTVSDALQYLCFRTSRASLPCPCHQDGGCPVQARPALSSTSPRPPPTPSPTVSLSRPQTQGPPRPQPVRLRDPQVEPGAGPLPYMGRQAGALCLTSPGELKSEASSVWVDEQKASLPADDRPACSAPRQTSVGRIAASWTGRGGRRDAVRAGRCASYRGRLLADAATADCLSALPSEPTSRTSPSRSGRGDLVHVSSALAGLFPSHVLYSGWTLSLFPLLCLAPFHPMSSAPASPCPSPSLTPIRRPRAACRARSRALLLLMPHTLHM